MSNVKAVSLGYNHSGAIAENDDLYMWGDNHVGQLGDGTTTDRLIPTKIMSNVKEVCLGSFHSGTITQNDDLYMWGYNYFGELGDGTTTDRYSPTKIANLFVLKLGDVNLDGIVNIYDVTLTQKYIANITELDSRQLKAADVTGDGYVNIYDVTKIQKYIAGLISSLSNS